MQTRIEQYENKHDFVLGRAITEFTKFVDLVSGQIKSSGINSFPNGIIYLKGGDFENEVKPFLSRITIYNISDIFSEEFFKSKKIIYLPVT